MTTAIQRTLQSRKECVLAIVTPAGAAELLDGLCIAHFPLKALMYINSGSTCNIEVDYYLGHDLCGTNLIISGETVMTYHYNLDPEELTVRDLQTSNLFIGGVVAVYIGNILQFLCVERASTQYQKVSKYFQL